jgi:nitroreductase
MDAGDMDADVRRCPSYRADAVPKAVVRDAFDQARHTPSWRTLKGWHIWVLEGSTLARYKMELTRRLIEDAPSSPELDAPDRGWPELCLARTARLMAVNEEATATAHLEGTREEKLARLGGLFDAPCLMVYGLDCHAAGTQGCFDSGAFVQSMCEAARAEGLETCVMATAVRYPELLHEVLPDEAGELFVVGIVLGYPEEEVGTRRYVGEPASFDDMVTWVD